MRNYFITGISGCVGHYFFDLLVKEPDARLYLLVRNDKKLLFDPKLYPNITIIHDNLANIEKYSELLKTIDYVLHLAADWGEKEGNYDHTLSFFKLLDPTRCKKAIYFSTASILGPDNRPIEAAEKFGTHYIRSKYRLLKALPKLEIYPRVTTLFPTWILGGDKNHPYSHALKGIVGLKQWLWLIRFFTVDASFHYIHARDIAQIVKYLLENETKENEYVLGNPPITASRLIRDICRFYNLPVCFQLPISLPLIQFLAFITRRQLHPWDLFCFSKRHFLYKTVDAESFGLRSDFKTVGQILSAL